MRLRYLSPIFLVAGIGMALLVASSDASTPCPSHYHFRRFRGHNLYLRRATRTVTSTRTMASAPTTVTQTTPASTVTVTDATTVPTTITDTTTQTTVSTDTQTVIQPVTITDTVTTVEAPSVAVAFCGGYGGNWKDGNCDAPPSPLTVPVGTRVELSAVAQGDFVSDPIPSGCLTFSLAQKPAGAVWSESDQEFGLNPAASADCSCVENFSGQASGACLYTFGTPGSYAVRVDASLSDSAYGSVSAAPVSTTLEVG